MLPAYKRFVPRSCLADLVKGVSNIIPPLSEADNFSLCVKLPILGAALRSSVNGKDSAGMKESDESIEEITNGGKIIVKGRYQTPGQVPYNRYIFHLHFRLLTLRLLR